MDTRPVLFASDLHLSPERPGKLALYARLMARAAECAQAVYLLGDLVEAWLGDDDEASPAPELIAGIRAASGRGVPVRVIRGNRDFLLGSRFEALSGAELLPDETVVELFGEPALIMHGDTLCLEDVDYQAFRRMVHAPAWQQAALARPLAERRAMAAHLRTGSRAAMAGKDEFLMDVTPGAVASALERSGARLLVHGHTHRPAVHDFALAGRACRRIVLPDWYEADGLLVCRPGEQRLLGVEAFLAER